MPHAHRSELTDLIIHTFQPHLEYKYGVQGVTPYFVMQIHSHSILEGIVHPKI